MTNNILMTPAEAAEVLAISRSVVYDLIAKGTLSSIKVGRSRRVLRKSLEDFVNRELSDQLSDETGLERGTITIAN
jgi:excisionase family DNA binding protein